MIVIVVMAMRMIVSMIIMMCVHGAMLIHFHWIGRLFSRL
jgi:hypothetical protein